MSKVEPIPAGREAPIPHLIVNDGARAIEFYKKAFGAEELMRVPGADGRILHAELRLGNADIFLADDFPEFCGGKAHSAQALQGSPVTIHRYVTDVDAAVRRAETAGATVKMPASDMFWGDRYGVIEDPFGHCWSFATHIKDLTPQEIAQGAKEAFAHAPGA